MTKEFEKIEDLVQNLSEKGSLSEKVAGKSSGTNARVSYENAAHIQHSDLAFLKVEAPKARHFIMDLRDHYGFTHLVFLTAVDYLEDGIFTLTYMLHNYEAHWDIGVQVDIPRENASMESIHDLWAQAATYQRELKEMFGIDFPDSPRVDEPFILEGWHDLPPMRREFDTKEYSKRTFFPRPGRSTNDPADYMRRKLYPEE